MSSAIKVVLVGSNRMFRQGPRGHDLRGHGQGPPQSLMKKIAAVNCTQAALLARNHGIADSLSHFVSV